MAIGQSKSQQANLLAIPYSPKPPIAEAFLLSIINLKKEMRLKLLKLSFLLKKTKNIAEASYLDSIIRVAGLHDTYWQNNEGKRATLMDLLDATKDIDVSQIPIEWIKPHLLDWNGEEEEIQKIEKADLRYPILIFVDSEGNFLSLIDGHHRAQKAIRHGMKTIGGKIIPIDSLPEYMKEIFVY